jgi:hypothetical protein
MLLILLLRRLDAQELERPSLTTLRSIELVRGPRMSLRAYDDPIERQSHDGAHDEDGGQIHWDCFSP